MFARRHLSLATVSLAFACGLSAQDPNATDPVISEARRAAAVFVGSLPKYLVKRTTTRSENLRPAGNDASASGCTSSTAKANPFECQAQAESWRIVDIVTADVVTDHDNEVDMNIRLNGAPSTEKQLDSAGSWSEGDFNGALQAILAPTSNALFTKKRAVTLAKRPAWRYEYSVDQAHSGWQLSWNSVGKMMTLQPAFGGTIWIDRDTSRVLSFDMAARNLPESFPYTKAEWTIDYDFVKVGDGSYLLPKHSETDNCERNISKCTRNVTEFQNYKEYVANTNISFDEGK